MSTSEVSDAKGVEESIQFAKKYLEDLLSFFGVNTDIYATTEDGEVIELHVPSTNLNAFLIGQHGDTMRALQYTVSAALKNNDFEVSRVNVDVADYKKARAERLLQTAEDWVAEVVRTGKEMELRPMNGADRRLIHKLAGESGLVTESVGEGRDRRVVLKPGSDVAASDVPKPDDGVDWSLGDTAGGTLDESQSEDIAAAEAEAEPETEEPA
jgi:spoIIIJ-associated protein